MPPSTRKTTRSLRVDPTPEEADSKYAPNVWLSGGVGAMEDLTLPSGQVCLVRRPGMQGLISAGVLRDADSLTSLVNQKHIVPNSRGGSELPADVKSLMQDEAALAAIEVVIDKVLVHCVVRPQVHRAPNDVTLRQPGVVYTDMVDLMDKMFVFNFVVGGTRDLESFRGEFDGLVGSLEHGEGVQDPAEQPV
jgi:hypothetical protein